MDGCLCLARDLRHRNDIFEIWRIADYESGEWSVDYRIVLHPVVKQHLMDTWLVVPLCYLDNDDYDSSEERTRRNRKIMIATAMQKVHVYDPKTGTLESVVSAVASTEPLRRYEGSSTPVNFLRITPVQESLVHVPGMQYGSNNMIEFSVLVY